MNEFTVHIVSSTSMKVFPQNTLPSFKNFFTEEIYLEGHCRVAKSQITFSAKLNQVNKNDLKLFSSEGPNFFEKTIQFDAVSRPIGGERRIIAIGSYEKLDRLLRSIKTASSLPHLD